MTVSAQEIERKLLKRFPSYQNLVPHISGDHDGLVMCGYEQEINHLVKEFDINNKNILEICTGIGICGILFAKHENTVHSYDINSDRTTDAIHNAKLFNVADKAHFYTQDVCEENFVSSLRIVPDVIYVDCDWRTNMNKDSVLVHSCDPFATCPRADKVFFVMRKSFPNALLLFKISAQANVQKFKTLGTCQVIDYQGKGKTKFYHVCFYNDPQNDDVVSLD